MATGPRDPDNPTYQAPGRAGGTPGPVGVGRNADPDAPRRTTRTAGSVPLSPAEAWWQRTGHRFQQVERDRVADPQFGTLYRNLLWNINENGWDQQTAITWMESKPGMLDWYAGPADSGGRGRGGGGGGGGGGGVDRGQAIEQIKAQVRNVAGTLGLGFTEDQITWVATEVFDNEWSEDQLLDSLTAAIDWAKLQPGTLTAGVDQVRQLGAEYLMSISDDTARDYSRRVASGEIDENGIRAMFTAQARSQYGWMGDIIDQGITPRAFLLPMRDRIADTLELAPETLDLMDPNVQKMLTITDPETKAERAATLTEVEMRARQDPRFASTKKAQDAMAELGVRLSELFGGRG